MILTNNAVKIGNVTIKNRVFVPPLAGITDKVFRRILFQMGAGFCYTEMVSAKALLYQNKKTHTIMDIKGEEEYCGIQLFGSDPKEMAFAAKMAEDAGAPLIDINMGCPVPKVVNNKEGSALLKDRDLALSIADAMVNAVNVPITVKLRKGFQGEDGGIFLAKELESVGVSAVGVHGRNRVDYYSGNADWQSIKKVKDNANIPIIGNGDVFSPQDAKAMLEETGVDAIMIGRGILGNPWLIRDTVAYLEGKEIPSPPNAEERIALAIQHFDESCVLYGDWLGIRYMRKFLGWYLKGFHDAAKVRHTINTMTNPNEVKNLLLLVGEQNHDTIFWDASIPTDI